MQLKASLGETSFVEKDVYNYVAKLGGEKKSTDVTDLIAALKGRKDEDPDFHYEFTVDAMNRLEHVFWMFPSSVELYRRYQFN